MKKQMVLIFVGCMLLSFAVLPGQCRAEEEFFPLQYRPASEVVPIVREMLSPGGTASFDQRTNTILVRDSKESIENIRGFLKRFDQPGKQATVRMRIQETGSASRRSARVEGSVSGRNWRVSKGRTRRNGVNVTLDDRDRRINSESEYFINVMSGSWAYIVVGKEIVFTEHLRDLCRRYGGGCAQGVVFRRIESGMDVRPTIMGNQADIEIVPRFSGLDPKGRKDIIRFTAASTRLTAPLGEWVTVGGTDSTSNEVMKALLERGSAGGSSSISISLMVQSLD